MKAQDRTYIEDGYREETPAGVTAARCLKVELKAARFLQQTLGPVPMARGLVRILRHLPGTDSSGIYLLDTDQSVFRLMAYWGLSEAFVERVRSFDVSSEWGLALNEGAVVSSRKPKS